jgi:hypothetical protein
MTTGRQPGDSALAGVIPAHEGAHGSGTFTRRRLQQKMRARNVNEFRVGNRRHQSLACSPA